MTPLAERALDSYARFLSGTFLLFGVVGLLLTHFDGFADNAGVTLLTLGVNPLTNLIHLAAGVIGIASHGTNRRHAAYLLGIGLAAVPFGTLEFAIGDGSADIFGRNDRTAVAQIALGAVALAVWAWARRSGAASPAPRPGRA